jgi:hypothetical protein
MIGKRGADALDSPVRKLTTYKRATFHNETSTISDPAYHGCISSLLDLPTFIGVRGPLLTMRVRPPGATPYGRSAGSETRTERRFARRRTSSPPHCHRAPTWCGSLLNKLMHCTKDLQTVDFIANLFDLRLRLIGKPDRDGRPQNQRF